MIGATPVLKSIHVYPIKSCAGVQVNEARLDAYGLEWDRRWMLVDEEGKFVTQRTEHRLAAVKTQFVGDRDLSLSAEGMPVYTLSLGSPEANRVRIKIWAHEGQALLASRSASEWFSDFLRKPVRLVELPRDFDRLVNPEFNPGCARVGFQDSFPILALGEASVGGLNRRIGESGGALVPIDRFRANLVFEGVPEDEEDSWREISVGSIRFVAGKPCVRCVATTVDQATGIARGPEPLATLASYRRLSGGNGVTLGMKWTHLDLGVLKTGAQVTVTSFFSRS